MNKKNLTAVICISFGTLLVSCSVKKSAVSSAEMHRNIFFPQISSNSIIEYKWYYADVRGGFITAAKIVLNTNSDILFNNYSNLLSTSEQSERNVVVDLLHAQAASLLGGTNKIPDWLDANTNSDFNYMEQKTSSHEFDLWFDKDKKIIYFVGISENSRQ